MLRDWGAEKKYQHVLKGYNYRLEGIQGAVLRVKLRHLEAWTEARRAAAARYDAAAGRQRRRHAACDADDVRHVYHIYAVRTANRRGLAGGAARAGHPDGHPLPDPGPPAAGVRRSGLPEWRLPALGARRERGAVAADVPGADAGAVRVRCATPCDGWRAREQRDRPGGRDGGHATADLPVQRQRPRSARLPGRRISVRRLRRRHAGEAGPDASAAYPCSTAVALAASRMRRCSRCPGARRPIGRAPRSSTDWASRQSGSPMVVHPRASRVSAGGRRAQRPDHGRRGHDQQRRDRRPCHASCRTRWCTTTW